MQNEIVSQQNKTVNKTESQPQAFSIKAAVCILGISRNLLWKSISSGKIKAVRLGRRTLIPASEINKILEF